MFSRPGNESSRVNKTRNQNFSSGENYPQINVSQFSCCRAFKVNSRVINFSSLNFFPVDCVVKKAILLL